MMSNCQDLQNRIEQLEKKFSADLQQVIHTNETFKQEIRSEIHRSQTGTPTLPLPALLGPGAVAPLNTPSSSTVTPVVVPSVSGQDFQNQMLILLNTTFSKLTTVLDTKSSDVKSEWPKFGGDVKKFKSWRLAILAQMSLSPWNELYDASTNSLVFTTLNSLLNEKLYAKLLLCLEGQVLQDMVSQKHLRANGLLLLSELTQTYRPSQVPEVTATKTAEFWGSLKRHQHETIDAYYYNRFHSLLDDLEEAGKPIATKSAIRQFIFTLGSDFSQIQNSFCIGHLPEAWQTEDWPSLLVLCRNYFNSIRPQGLFKTDPNSDFAGDSSLDRTAHHKKVKQWFMNPDKYKNELNAEQAKHAGKCIYHLTKSHPTSDCYIKKECEKLLAAKKNGTGNAPKNSTTTSCQLRHMTEEQIEEEECIEEVVDSVSE